MLLTTAGMLMLIGCANVAGLLTARALNRRKEFAICKALGGAAVGIGIDAWQRSWLRTIRWPSAYGLPFEFHFQSDRTLLLYALMAAGVAMAISTLAPALGSGDAQVSLAMKQGEPAFSARRWNLRSTFVALQVALATVLLTLGVLFARSLGQLAAAGPGFDAEHTLIAAVHMPPGRSDGDAGWDLRERTGRRIEATAGVAATSPVNVEISEWSGAHLRE